MGNHLLTTEEECAGVREELSRYKLGKSNITGSGSNNFRIKKPLIIRTRI